LLKGDLHLVKAIVAGFVDARRLAGGPDKQAGKQVGEGGMIVPVGDEAGALGRAGAGWGCRRGGTAQDDMIAPAGPRMPAIEHELLGAQPGFAGLFVKDCGVVDQLIPGVGRVMLTSTTPGSGVTLKCFRPGS